MARNAHRATSAQDGRATPSASVAGRALPDGAPLPGPPGRAVLDISKLLVEVLQVGHVARRGGAEPLSAGEAMHPFAGHPPVGGAEGAGPVSSHGIRAAIHLHGNGPQTVGQLAAGLGVSQGWASRVVDELESAGYVSRERDPDDRRVVRVRILPAAAERVEKAYRWRGDAVEAALEGMSQQEREAVTRFLRRFVDEVRAAAR